MLILGKVNTSDISAKDIENFEYVAVKPEDQWKVKMVQEIIEARENQVNIEHFETEELDDILEYLCII